MKWRLAYRAALVVAALGICGDIARAESIAVVTDVANEVYRRPPGQDEQPVRPGDRLVQDEVLRTGAGASIHIRFVDGSELSLEPQSEVVLSGHLLESAASTRLINLADGLFQLNEQGPDDRDATKRPDRQAR